MVQEGALRLVATTSQRACGTLLRMEKPASRFYLREWRKDRGWSQERLAEALDTTKATISRIEAGKQAWDGAFLEAAALALNTTPADIVRRRPEDPEAIEVRGLNPDQVRILNDMADQMRKAG